MGSKLVAHHPSIMFNFRTLAFCVFITPFMSIATTLCTDPPRNSCSFYADCLETRIPCASTEFDYAIGYGQLYCTKFQDNMSKFSERGQKWVVDTMQCLQDALIPEATGQDPTITTCQKLKSKAFETHPKCYIQSGVCQLPRTDWEALLNIIGIKTLFQSWGAFLQALDTAAGCLELWLYFGLGAHT